jgi:2-oxoglutarate ferredoxin oxidoreductase subunit delta
MLRRQEISSARFVSTSSFLGIKITNKKQIMAKVIGAVVVDNEECKGCGLCVVACPQDVLSQNKQVNSRGYHYSFMKNPEACIGCSNCATVCPDTCITVYRVKI